MKHSSIRIALILGLLPLGMNAGCTTGNSDGWRFAKTLDVRKIIKSSDDEPTPAQMPTRMVSTWQEATLNTVGKTPQRGFGGRLLFFNAESEQPIRVAGQLVVYAYDENGRPKHETHPTRRYVFPAEQFVRHESECQLGPSYSVWIPWDEVGGPQQNISLIARFEPQGGPLIVGDQTRHLLPGTLQLAEGDTAPPTKPIGDIKLTQYTQTSQLQPGPTTQDKPRPQVTSIALSQKEWAKRLAAAQEPTTATTAQAQDSVPE